MWWIEISDLKNRKAIYLELPEENCRALYRFISSISINIPLSFGYIGNDGELNCVGSTNIDSQYRKKSIFNGEKPELQVECFLSGLLNA